MKARSKYFVGIGIIAAILAVAFLPTLDFGKMKAYLSISESGSYGTEIVWGQAYSPIAGWINFYCDGSGNTQPPNVQVNYPELGVATMSDTCSDILYKVEYDPTSKAFSGFAYSSNYGWLEMAGVKMDTPVGGLPVSELTGKSNGSELAVYNFGKTYFEADDPNESNPGVRYYNEEGYFCGFAYSEKVGFISFCDPQTKERPGKNISVAGYDWNTYAVYMGIPESYPPLPPELPPSGVAPTLSTTKQVLAANDNFGIRLDFLDNAAGVKSVVVTIPDANSTNQTYSVADDGGINDLTRSAWIDISGHDFHKAAGYNLTYTACDNLDNCATVTIPGFFTVVANVPFFSETRSYWAFSTGEKLADGSTDARHAVLLHLEDEYGNPIISVGNPIISVDGIKSVSAEFIFENTTDLDQIAGTGDSAVFASSEFGMNREGGTTTGVLTEPAGGDGEFQINVGSFAPTSAGYEPIASDGIELNFDKFNLNIASIGGYSNVGAYSQNDIGGGSSDENRKFGFEPTLVSIPKALVWNPETEAYEVDPEGVKNITINAPKRFGLDLKNQSTLVVTAPQIGIAIDNGATSNIEWQNGVIEKIGSETDLNETLPLDIDTNSTFDESLKDLSRPNWIPEILAGVTDALTRFRATPVLVSSDTSENLDTTLQTYVCYSFAGKDICHRSEKLSQSVDPGDPPAVLYNPSIEIIGSVRSIAGTSSKQTGTEVNQSIGDVVQSEFRESISRNLAALLANPTNVCGDTTTVTTGAALANLDCWQRDDSVLYFKNADLTLALTDQLPSGVRTIVINGGNLHIRKNLELAGANSSLGIIILKNAGSEKGNLFIYPEVVNAVGAVYAEGSVISVNKFGNSGEDNSSNCTGALGFCDRSYELRNQLYWKGLLATANTIGGSDQNPPQCPAGVSGCDRTTARIYDLAYLRTYHPDSGGDESIKTSSSAAFVVEYDVRIQNNPPPLFESVAATSGEQIGN